MAEEAFLTFVTWTRPETLVAEVTPLSPTAKVVGGLLGMAVLLASGYLLRRQIMPKALDDAGRESFAEHRGWRVPAAVVMALCGLLVLLGILIDPRATPRLFVYYWTFIFVIVLSLVPVAAYDLLVIRRRALRQRLRLLEESREQIRQEIQGLRPKNHRANGHARP